MVTVGKGRWLLGYEGEDLEWDSVVRTIGKLPSGPMAIIDLIGFYSTV